MKINSLKQYIVDIQMSKFKIIVKQTLVEIQNAFDETEWYPEQNFSFRKN